MEIKPSSVSAKAMNLRLRTHYVCLAIGLSVIPVLLIVLLTHQSLKDRLTRLDDRARAEATSIVSSNLLARFDLLRSKLRTLADMPPVLGLIRAQDGLGIDAEQSITAEVWSERFTDVLRGFGANDRSIRSLRLVSQNERVLAREDFRDGVIVPADSRPAYEPSDDPAFINTYRMAEGRIFVSQLRKAGPRALTNGQDSFISIAVPVRYQGRARAVIIVDAQASALLEQLSGPLRSSDVILSDAQGQYVAVGDMSKDSQSGAASLFADWPGLDPRKLDTPQYSTSLGRELVATLIDVNPGGVASFWMLGMIKNGNVVEATMTDITSVVLQWTVVFALLAISIALIVAEHKRKPLLRIAEAARQMKTGESTSKIPALGNDELGEVTRELNDVLDAMHASNKSLRDARILAAESARAKASLFAQLCLGIRAPITSIQDNLNRLERTTLDSEQRDEVLGASGALRVMSNALDDVTDYARIEAGQLTIDHDTFDLRQVVEECVGIFLRRAQEKNVELLSYLPADLPVEVIGDATRIRQVLMCLLANAVGRTDHGEVSLSMRCRVDPGARYGVRFDIKDAGGPISEDARKKIFAPLARLDHDVGQGNAEVGLGLTISQRLIELMNGEVGIDSKDAQGCLFWFEVPLRSAEGRGPMPPVLDESSTSAPKGDFAGLRVLLVEDNLVNQQVTLYTMKRMGAEVTTATNGRLALDALALRDFDLILMDCHMPEMDGFVATRQIRDREKVAKSPPVPIIAMTSNTLSSERERCLGAGANECLVKPFDQEQLRKLMAKWASARDLQAPAPSEPAIESSG